MNTERIARWFGFVFFTFWWILIRITSGQSPTSGETWLLIADLAAALLVYFRVQAYLNWALERKRGRMERAMGEGLVIGFLFALISTTLPSSGKMGVELPIMDRKLWFGVFSLAGAFIAGVVYLFSARVVRSLERTAYVYHQSIIRKDSDE
jgi:hypothetical protein